MLVLDRRDRRRASSRRAGGSRGIAELARWVGTRHKPIASDLLSSVELRERARAQGCAVARARRCARRRRPRCGSTSVDPRVARAAARAAGRAQLGARRDRASTRLFLAVLPMRARLAPPASRRRPIRSTAPSCPRCRSSAISTATLTFPRTASASRSSCRARRAICAACRARPSRCDARVLAPAMSVETRDRAAGTAPPKDDRRRSSTAIS